MYCDLKHICFVPSVFVKMALKPIACTGIQCMCPLLELFMGKMHLYQVLPFNSINIPGERIISI